MNFTFYNKYICPPRTDQWDKRYLIEKCISLFKQVFLCAVISSQQEDITPILLTHIFNLYTGYLPLSLIDCYVLTGILTCLRYIPSLIDTILIHQSSL